MNFMEVQHEVLLRHNFICCLYWLFSEGKLNLVFWLFCEGVTRGRKDDTEEGGGKRVEGRGQREGQSGTELNRERCD